MASGTRRTLYEVPAAGVIENILAGTPLQYPGQPSSVEVYASCEVAGIGDVTMDVIFGTDTVAENVLLPGEPVVGGGPVIPDQKMVADACASSDQVQIRLRNANVAIMDATVVVVVQPV